MSPMSVPTPAETPIAVEPRKRINLRTPDIMAAVQAQVESHYRSELVERIRARGGIMSAAGLTVRLAKQFGFCYGVERAIDLAYAAKKSKEFEGRRLFILGEIIHNPEVNAQIAALGIKNLIGPKREAEIDNLTAEDVVIVPAFGAEVGIVEQIKALGCYIVDTTCGDVMSVWRRVRSYAADEVTSIIHGKAQHEETKATASQARSKAGRGHYLVVLTLEETDYVCDYIRQGGDRQAFLDKFSHAHSEGFDPEIHLKTVGVANQTTMLRGETEEVQRRIRQAIIDRDGTDAGVKNFRFFDTICGATQERQDALKEMLVLPMNLCWWSAVTTARTPRIWRRWVRRSCRRFSSATRAGWRARTGSRISICTRAMRWSAKGGCRTGDTVVGVTAGASCPNHLIEETIKRLFAFRGVNAEELV